MATGNVTPIVQGYRDGLAKGELHIQVCDACGKPNMWPRYACPHCQNEELHFEQASGKGKLMSFTPLRLGAPEGFEQDMPYAMGVILLEEGVQILSRLVPDDDGDWLQYECDQEVVFVPTPDKDEYAVFKRA
jgi:uncharacterized OB-fold protein